MWGLFHVDFNVIFTKKKPYIGLVQAFFPPLAAMRMIVLHSSFQPDVSVLLPLDEHHICQPLSSNTGVARGLEIFY